MKKSFQILFFSIAICISSCNNENKQLADNINMYSNTWDEIINNGKLELFDTTHFDEDITLIMNPENVKGIDNVKDFIPTILPDFPISRLPSSMCLARGIRL